MNIESGMLVKTLSGTVVKVEKELLKGYWRCDDGRMHLGQALREVDADEASRYAAAQSRPGFREDNTDTR
jgi:hypothetical protein